MTIEEKVSNTILEDNIEFTIGGKSYQVAPPSIATLIMVSKEISKLPKMVGNMDDILKHSLAVARYFEPLGMIAAILILGAREARREVKRTIIEEQHRSWFGLIPHLCHSVVKTTKSVELANEILETMPPREVSNMIARILQGMQIGDFFGISTFLQEINLTKATKVDEQTVSGQ